MVRILWCCVLFMFFSVAHADEPVFMPDATLRNVVRSALGLQETEPLTKENMKGLRVLDANFHNASDGQGIADLTGLECAVNVEYLYLGGNQNHIQDLRPLSNLVNLRGLHIWHNYYYQGPVTDLDLTPLANLVNLEFISLEGNGITDITPLSNLVNLRLLHLTHNLITDYSPLDNLSNLVELRYDQVCLEPALMPVETRIERRNFPSVVSFWSEGPDSVRYDFSYGHFHSLYWDITAVAPTHGLATQLAGNIDFVRATRQQLLDENPDMLFFTEIRLHNHLESNGSLAFPVDSEFYLRNSEDNIIRNSVGEYMMDIINPAVQDLLIERIVGFSECGLFDGVLFDGMANHGKGGSIGEEYVPYLTREAIIEAHVRIFREVRARVRDDFLMIVNANRTKPIHYAEYINGSSMEPGADYAGVGGGTHSLLQELDNTLLWNEKHLRTPIVNWAEFFYLPTEPPNSPANEQRMRLATTRGLTLSDGYVRLTYPGNIWRDWLDQGNYWHEFWDTDLGRPIGEKGQLYDEDIEGLFIREFTNGWAVYNRSGTAQSVQLPQSIGVASHKTGSVHTVPDLDGEMFLKVIIDLNDDGVVNILDLVIIANAFGEKEPDLNGDGVVNILDLVIIANGM